MDGVGLTGEPQVVPKARSPLEREVITAPARRAAFLQCLLERRHASPCLRVVRGLINEHADAPHPIALLGTCHERPHRRAPDACSELPSSDHWMTMGHSPQRLPIVPGRARAFAGCEHAVMHHSEAAWSRQF